MLTAKQAAANFIFTNISDMLLKVSDMQSSEVAKYVGAKSLGDKKTDDVKKQITKLIDAFAKRMHKLRTPRAKDEDEVVEQIDTETEEQEE